MDQTSGDDLQYDNMVVQDAKERGRCQPSFEIEQTVNDMIQ